MPSVWWENTFPLVASCCERVGDGCRDTCITRMNSLNTLGDALDSAQLTSLLLSIFFLFFFVHIWRYGVGTRAWHDYGIGYFTWQR